MKKNLTLILFGFLPLFALSQIQQAFNYQAAVRNSNGEIQFDTTVSFKIEILQNGNVEYSENHFNKETGKTGVVNFKVGNGVDTIGDFSSIDWNQGNLQIRVHLKLLGGQEEEMGTADIVAVPIALYAESSGDSHWIKTDTSLYYSETKIGLGTNNPTSPLHIHTMNHNQGLRLSTQGLDKSIYLHLVENGNGVEYGYFHLGGGTVLRGSGQRSSFEGDVGIGTNDPQGKLHVNSNGELIRLQGVNHAYISFYQHPNNADRSGYLGYGASSNNNFYLVNDQDGSMVFRTSNVTRMIISESGNIGIGTTQPSEKLHVEGTTKTKILEITGGGDGAEYFNIKESDKLEKGSLVIIDEDNEGKLKISLKAYDTRVAGVISGAGGVNPGITLKQEEVLEGDELVSLWGRVYVKATTENGKINPGDLLTSSNLEGHAMKATKKNKSRGAIIGKALSSLDEGEGLVLILIQPQ